MVAERKTRQLENELPGASPLRLVERVPQPGPAATGAGPRSEGQERLSWRSAEVFGLLATNLAWACTSVLTITFIIAATSPARSVLVTVNQYGEMGVEAVLLAITWAAVSAHTVMQWVRAWKGPKRSQQAPVAGSPDSPARS